VVGIGSGFFFMISLYQIVDLRLLNLGNGIEEVFIPNDAGIIVVPLGSYALQDTLILGSSVITSAAVT
jgi:hypothetical protein